jgi:hypothetical protein
MSTNPFSAPASEVSDQHKLNRERVKVTFYTVLGTLVFLCLVLLIQGCKHHQPESENPIKNRQVSLSAHTQS